MEASNRTRKIRKEGKYLVFNSQGLYNLSHRFFLRYFRFLTSLVQVILCIWSLIFHCQFFNQVPCDLKHCSIRVNVMAWYTVSATASTYGSSKQYHVMGFFLQGSCSLPVFNFFHLVCLIDLAKLLKLQEINWLK